MSNDCCIMIVILVFHFIRYTSYIIDVILLPTTLLTIRLLFMTNCSKAIQLLSLFALLLGYVHLSYIHFL